MFVGICRKKLLLLKWLRVSYLLDWLDSWVPGFCISNFLFLFFIALNTNQNPICLMWTANRILSNILKTVFHQYNMWHKQLGCQIFKQWVKFASRLFFENYECHSGWKFPLYGWDCNSLVHLAGCLSVIFQHGSRDDKVMHSRSPEIGLDALPTQILSWVHHEEPLKPTGLLFAFQQAGEWFHLGHKDSAEILRHFTVPVSVHFMLFIWFLYIRLLIWSWIRHTYTQKCL